MRAFWYYLGLMGSYVVNALYIRTKIYYEDESKQNKRIKGKAIVICNHKSPLDGLVILQKYPQRMINYVIADFFQHKLRFVAPLIRYTGGLIVDREAFNWDFYEKCKQLLNKEKVVLIFSEGRFNFGYEPIRFVNSYLMLALQSGAPIVPILSDLNYGWTKRVHILIGNSIDASTLVSPEDMSKEAIKKANEEIYQKLLSLYYQLKKRKYEKLSSTYSFSSPKPGDVIRISAGTHYHYGVYLSHEEVIQFGHAVNTCGETVVVNAVTLDGFCNGKLPEVRELTRWERRYVRDVEDIQRYARQCIGRQGYNPLTNNCLDFANRVVLK
ncbi:MAG: 1-acyl-sn-glycerol-3-phosphate acyltransferase [Coriobacteriia bacterium]|nr:1-acyl-sn-glycerol-3-phosphate acyltransferase [Coriobacteriia bacterium]